MSEMKWQPIETAPRGRNVLLWAPCDGITDWQMETGWIRRDDGDPFQPDKYGMTGVYWRGRWLKPHDTMPTHWHPLPAPPAEEPR